MDISFGVYLGKDIEVVYTEKFSMIFRRNNEKDFLESILLNSENLCIGFCRTSPCSMEMSFTPDKWENALLREKVIYSDKSIKDYLGKHMVRMYAEGNKVIVIFYDGSSYEAYADELFEMEQLSPICYSSDEELVSECLKTWNIACKEIIWNNEYIGVIINTYKHMYIFEMTEKSIYCRAARYATCNKGVVFNQNFRQGYNAYMIADNREAMNELTYEEDLFNDKACVWNDRSVYWSVYSVEKDKIKLRGCQGDRYEWSKPR